MWTRFKRKFTQLFQKQEETVESKIDYEHLIKSREGNQTQEKGYPNEQDKAAQSGERSFRFPLIPDEQLENITDHKVTRKSSPLMRPQETINRRNNNVRVVEQSSRKKQPRKGFTPTRVPSPIYGYNERTDTQKIEQVPTFMRQESAATTESETKNSLTKGKQTSAEQAAKDRFLNIPQNRPMPSIKNATRNHTIKKREKPNVQNRTEQSFKNDQQSESQTRVERTLADNRQPNIQNPTEQSLKDEQQAEGQAHEGQSRANDQQLGYQNRRAANIAEDKIVNSGPKEFSQNSQAFDKKLETIDQDLNTKKTKHETVQASSIKNRKESIQNDEKTSGEAPGITKPASKGDFPISEPDKHFSEQPKAQPSPQTGHTHKNRSERRREKRRNRRKHALHQTNSQNTQTEKALDTKMPRKQSAALPFNVMMTPKDQKKQISSKPSSRAKENRLESVDHPTSVKRSQNSGYQESSTSLADSDKRKIVGEKESTSQGTETATEDYSIPYHLLNDPPEKSKDDEQWVLEQIETLERTLQHFKVDAKVVHASQGPTVTRFEVKPAIGVKVSRIRNLNDDLKLNMAARDIRIEAPIPGKNTIGIEIPNLNPQMVTLLEIFQTEAFQQTEDPLPVGLGLDVEGKPAVTSVAKMPHGLIAGATGSGKSVCINTLLISLIYKESYTDLKMLLIDPKMVELAAYNGIPHLVSPVITDIKAATAALKWAVGEMEERYEKFSTERTKNIKSYNEKMVQEGRESDKLPYVIIVIDELADLMMSSPQDVEDAIIRIAQMARAAGMHLVIATQRPSVDVITGLIKANIPTRIAFSVSSQVDSRTILDTNGAERLLGQGDMLFAENGSNKGVRLQGAFVSDDEIERVTAYLRKLAPANYLFEQEELLKQIEIDEEEDELFPDAVAMIIEQDQASTSMLQRHFRIGYNRAARLIDSLEAKGIISGPKGSKPRQVLMSKEQLDEIFNG